MAGVPMLVFVRRLLVCVAATTVAFGASSWQASALDETRPSCTGLEPGPARTVTRIIDGETAALDDGTELRLIGALAPRAIDAGTSPARGRQRSLPRRSCERSC